MDSVKGIEKDFVYFIGKKPTTEASLVKDNDAQNMKVEDFRRPMSMCFILFMITAVSFIVTWYLLKPVAITIAATEILQTTVDMEAAFLPLQSSSKKSGIRGKKVYSNSYAAVNAINFQTGAPGPSVTA